MIALPNLPVYGGVSPGQKKAFEKPTPEEALVFLQLLPRVWRSAKGKKILVQLWEDYTVEDLKTVRLVHPGGHIEDPTAPNRFSRHHLRLRPKDWRYFTVFGRLEQFEMGHDMPGVTDECLFYLGHGSSISRHRYAVSSSSRLKQPLRSWKSSNVTHSSAANTDFAHVALVGIGR
jgi:hypothetical protein